MSFRIAHDFEATCVMIEHSSGESGGLLKKLCELNTQRDNVILLYKKITAEELRLLSQTEHFDVVLAMNIDCEGIEYIKKKINGFMVKVPQQASP